MTGPADSEGGDVVIKAVAVRQPEVTRLAAGEATIEVKTWRTDYRGELLLVSALTPWIEPAGYAIAVGRLIDCRPMTRSDDAEAGKKYYTNAQSWVFADIRPIRIFPVKIGRNVFDVPVPSFGIQRITKVALTPATAWSLKSRAAAARRASLSSSASTSTPPPLGEGTPHPPGEGGAGAGAVSLDILVVDADPLLGRGVQRCVLPDHRVRSVPSCAEALEAVKARLPDVVICDFQLGTESSEPLLRALATSYPQVRRILYSSSHRDVWTRTIDSDLVHGALTKPATRDQLLAVIAI